MAAPSVAGVAAGAMPLGSFDQALLSINSNPYFIGTMMLMMNFGGRFLAMEMSPGQEAFFQNKWVRRLLIFIVIFMGTRNILVAFWMSLVIILLIGYLFNENSSLCIFHLGSPGSKCGTMPKSNEKSFEQNPGKPPFGPTGGASPIELASQIQPAIQFTPEEADIFKRLNEKQLRIASQNRQVSTGIPETSIKSMSDLYLENMNMLNHNEEFINRTEGFRERIDGSRVEGFIGNPRF
jgi:hypothetical protein